MKGFTHERLYTSGYRHVACHEPGRTPLAARCNASSLGTAGGPAHPGLTAGRWQACPPFGEQAQENLS